MPGYYAYIIGDDGHIQERVDLISDDDEQAKRRAKQLVDGHSVEYGSNLARSLILRLTIELQRKDIWAVFAWVCSRDLNIGLGNLSAPWMKPGTSWLRTCWRERGVPARRLLLGPKRTFRVIAAELGI